MDYREIKEFFFDSIKYIIGIILIICFLMYVATFQQVVGPSMSPNLKNSDLLILNKAVYKLREPKRGEVISFEYTGTKYLIKRIIGLPGESIEVKNNILYIDGKPFEEDYLDSSVITKDFKLDEKIPKDSYFVMGDNRMDSMDSRDFGPIKEKDIIGKVLFRIWPINKIKLVK